MNRETAGLRAALQAFEDLCTAELYAILRLRAEVFVVEQACAYQDLDGLDAGSLHFGRWAADGRLVAYARLLPPGLDFAQAAAIGRVITAGSVRGTGVGYVHFAESIVHCERLWAKAPIMIHAQCYLEGWYGRHGFRAVGEPYIEDGIPHVHMLREVSA